MKKICNLIVLIVLMSGCASIVSKSDWPVRISSEPMQADIIVTDVKRNANIFTGKTPTVIVLSSHGGFFKGKTYKVQISKEGFETQTAEIKSTLNGWYLWNFPLIFAAYGGAVGLLIIDPATGAMWKLDPKDVNLILEKKSAELP